MVPYHKVFISFYSMLSRSNRTLKSPPNELRQDLATKNWVVIAPERIEGRPLQSTLNQLLEELPVDCPFCPHSKFATTEVELEKYPPNATDDWMAR